MAHILVADDDSDIREILEIVLGPAHVVRGAADGFQVMQALADGPVDLLLLDVDMPLMSGLEVVQAMRADGDMAHVPVMMLSALSAREDRAVGLSAGADEYLAKPFGVTDIVRRVDDMLASRAA